MRAALLAFLLAAIAFAQTPVQVVTDPNTTSPFCSGSVYGTPAPDEINIYTGVHWTCTNQIWTIAGVGQGLLLTTTSAISPSQLSAAGATNGYVLTANAGAVSFQPATGGISAGSNISLLNNDSGYQTASQLSAAIAAIGATNLAATGHGGVTGTLPIANGGTGTTAAQGNGSKVQFSTGSTTPNDCVKFDANGNTMDAGAACGAGGASLPNVTNLIAGNNVGGGADSGIAPSAVCLSSGTHCPTSGGSIPGTQYTTNNGTSTTGFAASLTACGTTISCSVIAPPNYGVAELPPCIMPDPNSPVACTTSANVNVYDNRYGQTWVFNNLGSNYNNSLQYTNFFIQQNVPASIPSAHISQTVQILQNSWGGGINYCELSAFQGCAKTTFKNLAINAYSTTAGQHNTLTIGAKMTSVGDLYLLGMQGMCWGGYLAKYDEGCEWMDIQTFQGNVEITGTVSANATSPASITLTSVSVGESTQGQGRYLARMNAGTVSGTATAFSTSNGGPTLLTNSAASYTPSSVIASLSSNITAPGLTTITPTSYIIGSGLTGLTTSTPVVIGDQDGYESVYPVTIGSTSFTANTTKVHVASGSVVAWGGYATYLLEFNADRVTNSMPPTDRVNPIIGTLHTAWPVLGNTATVIYVWIGGAAGGWGGYVGQFSVGGSNAYTLYQGAEVTNVLNAGVVSDTLNLAANKITEVSGDTFQEFIYPSIFMSGGNWLIEGSSPNQGGVGWTYRIPLNNNGSLLGITLDQPDAVYNWAGGQLYAPHAIYIHGARTVEAIKFDRAPIYAGLWFGCGEAAGCGPSSANIPMLRASTYGGGDNVLFMNPVSGNIGYNYNHGAGYKELDGSSGSLPATPATSGITYTLTATPSGSSTSTYTATAVQTIPSCSTLVAANTSGPCQTAAGAIVNNVGSRYVTSGTSDTISTSDTNGLVVYDAAAFAVTLAQANLGGNWTPGQLFTISNYGTGAVTVSSSTSYIGHNGGVSQRIIPAASGSGSSQTVHSCTFVSSYTNTYTSGSTITNWDLKDCN